MALVVHRNDEAYQSSSEFEELNYFLWTPLSESYDDDKGVEGNSQLNKAWEKLKKDEFRTSSTKKELSRIEQAFVTAANGGKTVPLEKAIIVARKFGYAPSRADERLLKKQCLGSVTYEEFSSWLSEIRHTEDTTAFLSGIFQKYDTSQNGYLTKKQIQTIVTEMGDEDSLTLEEFDILARMTNLNSDSVSYEELCKRLLQPKREEA